MADDADREQDARHARARVVSQVIREHEERPMGCSCGARLGDSIDATWHLANQVAEAVGAHVRREVRERIAQEIERAVGEGTASDIARGANTMSTPIERAVDVWLDDIDKRGLVLDPDIATQDVRAIFASIDTDELAEVLIEAYADWMDAGCPGSSTSFQAEAVKAHLLKEDA